MNQEYIVTKVLTKKVALYNFALISHDWEEHTENSASKTVHVYGTIYEKLNVLRLYYVRTYGYRSIFIPRVRCTTSLVEAYLQNR